MMIEALKQTYWARREKFIAWRRRYPLEEIRRLASLRLRALLRPIVEIEGVRIYRGSGLTVPVLEALDERRYEKPETRITLHALRSGDTVLELGTGLGFISSLCARKVGDGNVHSFEANPALERIIKRNYWLNRVSPSLNICLLGEENGSVTFYVMKNFWSSSTIQGYRAKPIQVPTRRFNDELERLRPNFLIIDIEGGEHDLIHYARLDGVEKVCIELHPHLLGEEAVAEVEAFFLGQGFQEDLSVSDPDHKLYLRDPK